MTRALGIIFIGTCILLTSLTLLPAGAYSQHRTANDREILGNSSGLLNPNSVNFIRGHVYDYDGKPVPNVLVIATGPYFASTETNTEGAYELQVNAPATYTISVLKYPIAQLNPSPTEITVPPDRTDLDFRFPTRYPVHGLVKDAQGQPLNDAIVSATLGPMPAQAWTDVTGAYTMSLIEGTYHLQATYKLLPAPPQVIMTVPDQLRVDFTFPPWYTIGGRVRDAQDRGISGASVVAKGPVFGQATTDRNGVYTITVTTGIYSVSAMLAGYPKLPAQEIRVPPSQFDVNFTFPARYTVTGTVRDAQGRPLRDAVVSTLAGPANDADTTATDGSYTLTLVAGHYTLGAAKSGWFSPPPREIDLIADIANLDFTFPLTFTISGTLKDSRGQPLMADVNARSDSGLSAGPVTAGVNGNYVLTVITGTWSISASSLGMPESLRYLVTVPPAQSGLDITFPPTHTVQGVIQDENGHALAGVRIFGAILSAPETGTDGRFTAVVGEGEAEIWAEKPDYDPSVKVLVKAEQNVDGVNLVLSRQTRIISGQVSTQAGAPVSDARIVAQDLQCGGSELVGWSDPSGSFNLKVSPGFYAVRAEADGQAPMRPVHVDTSVTDITGLDLQLPRAFLIQGTVHDHRGQPVTGALVSADGCETSSPQVKTDSSGAYELALSPGLWTIRVEAARHIAPVPRLLIVESDLPKVDFVLPESYPIRGIVSLAGVSPIPQAYVTAKATDGTTYTSQTDRDGFYELWVPPGSHLVEVKVGGYEAPVTRTVTVPPVQSRTNFVLSSGTPAWISGHVRGPEGAPVNTAKLVYSLVPNSSPAGSRQVYHDGSFHLPVIPGEFRIRAEAACYGDSPEWHSHVPPQGIQIELNLPRAEWSISGTVVDMYGAPLCAAQVRAQGAGGEDVEGWTGADGRYRLPVAAGTWSVTASRSDSMSQPKQVSLPPDATGIDFKIPFGIRRLFLALLSRSGH